MGTVLIEISWQSSGRAVMRIRVDRASAQAVPHRATGPGTVIGDLARDMRKAFKEEYPQGRPNRHRLRGPRPPHLRGVRATGILQYSKPARTVSPWQETIAQSLRALHLNSLRSRLLVLALVATLIPTVAILSSYRHEQPSLSDTVAQELRSVSSEAARQADVWLDERLSDLRAAAGAFAFSENLARARPGGEHQAAARPRAYLASVRERCAGGQALP